MTPTCMLALTRASYAMAGLCSERQCTASFTFIREAGFKQRKALPIQGGLKRLNSGTRSSDRLMPDRTSETVADLLAGLSLASVFTCPSVSLSLRRHAHLCLLSLPSLSLSLSCMSL